MRSRRQPRMLSPRGRRGGGHDGLAAEAFLALPHPKVGAYWAKKTAAPDRWLRSIRRAVAAATQ
jgi:hypothetical protein